ncbi:MULTISPECIES: Lin0512 family protein [Clostridium]|nr:MULTISPECIES: Lin0512 family protein [Clostridium]MDS1007423.1 Lin0512 family protein [Clostridium sporogenes]MDU7251547.1 Lin0512 family protein [Clostridium sp.]
MKLIERYIIEFGLGMDFHGQDVNMRIACIEVYIK